MTALSIYPDDGRGPPQTLRDFAIISARLGEAGVLLERWRLSAPLPPGASQEQVLAAYTADIETLEERYGFTSVDVVGLQPDHPNKDEMRKKFLSEHTHADFEVRFFVEGSGVFYLHIGPSVYVVLCTAGDLISVPAKTTHWFDMGSAPSFRCIRFFTTEDGWVGDFTGSDIATRFPDYDAYVAQLAQEAQAAEGR